MIREDSDHFVGEASLIIENFLQNCLTAMLPFAIKCHGDHEKEYMDIQLHMLALSVTRKPYFAMIMKQLHDHLVFGDDANLSKIIAVGNEQGGNDGPDWS